MTLARTLSRRSRAALAAVLLACCALLATGPLAGCGQEGEEPATEAEAEADPVEIAHADEPAVESTPRDEWGKGTMPYLYQIDPEWAETDYSGGPFAKTGCGPTALSMVYIYLTGNTDLDPVQMGQFSTEHGYATDGEGTLWALMSEGASELGLTGTGVLTTPDALRATLETGAPVICVMNPGTFTDIGHFIVIERLGADGRAVVHDPNSVGRSMRTWDLELICSEAAGAWSFSVAEGA